MISKTTQSTSSALNDDNQLLCILGMMTLQAMIRYKCVVHHPSAGNEVLTETHSVQWVTLYNTYRLASFAVSKIVYKYITQTKLKQGSCSVRYKY